MKGLGGATPAHGAGPTARTKVLFTGYAPVHFACFKPLYDQLVRLPGLEVRLSGGLRTKTPDGVTLYDPDGMYGPFGVAREAVLSVQEIAEMDFDLLFAANTKKIEPRSFARSIEIFHGMSFRNRAIRAANEDKDHYFVLGPYMMRGFTRHGIFAEDDERAVEVGFPKTDRLLNGELDRTAVRSEHGLSGDRPVVLYAPTGAKRNSLETMGEEVIRRLAGTGAYDLLVKPHDHPKNKIDWFERLGPLEGTRMRLVRAPDVIPSLFIADVLVTDASSVANEYALLDRPMVFLDVPELIEAAAVRPESSLDLHTWGRKGGQIAADADEALTAVEDGLEHPERHSDIRAGIVDDLFYNPGRATGAGVEFVQREMQPA